ncbi:class A beta-lactamase [Tabrizicola sp.]|uniref:class A beta-lactamase n=1 Tax=Tabrizicola sp. TaxID=2005166 RepID=UPI003F2CE6E5
MLTRRHFIELSGTAVVLAAGPIGANPMASGIYEMIDAEVAAIEASTGGRLGVAVLDTGSGTTYSWRGDELFPILSTFKFLLAGAVLHRVDAGEERLDRAIPVRAEDLVPHAPTVEPLVGKTITVGQLCEATVTLSDNAAANILLATMNGPEGLTAFIRTLGDQITRLDRWEIELNEAAPGDPRDTTTPQAMIALMQQLILGDALSDTSRRQLTAWLIANQTGDARIRAGAPEDWTVGDKTGTGENGTFNDIAILLPPERAPILLAVYLTQSIQTMDNANAAIAAVALTVTGVI